MKVYPRTLARSVAKHNLGENAHRAIKSGHFATNWRTYALPQILARKENKVNV